MARLFLLLPVLVLLGASPQTPPPNPKDQATEAPAFPAAVELVTVDAVVVDGKGHGVPGFTKADFTVLENGTPQTVTRFEAVVLPDEPKAAAPPVRRAAY